VQPAARTFSHYWTIEAVSLESSPMRLPSRTPAFVIPSFLLAGLTGLFATSPASAAEGFVGTRSLGMGETLRGAATAGTGPLLNPSGMTLTQQYNIEADYFFARVGDNQNLHASIVDSTSGYKVAGGLYYTYHTDNPDGPSEGHGHEVGLALAVPFGEHVSIGATAKYFALSGDQVSPGSDSSGFTYDVGITLRPANVFSLGVVGYNLRDLNLGVAPRSIGYGVVLSPTDFLLIAVDGVTNLTADAPLPRTGTRVSAGAELFLAKKVALRAGGGYDGITQNGFFTAGLSAVSEAGALDFGLRQDAFQRSGAPRDTILAAGFRLFVPQP
jgi:hypothetical protein